MRHEVNGWTSRMDLRNAKRIIKRKAVIYGLVVGILFALLFLLKFPQRNRKNGFNASVGNTVVLSAPALNSGTPSQKIKFKIPFLSECVAIKAMVDAENVPIN